MPDTYFILATESEIAQLKTIENVLEQMDRIEPLFGARNFPLEATNSLCKVFWDNEKSFPTPTKYKWSDGSQFYIFDKELCKKVALTEWDDLLQASVPWSESEPWKSVEHNRMDLAGMIIDFASLCKQTDNEKSLYILLSNEK